MKRTLQGRRRLTIAARWPMLFVHWSGPRRPRRLPHSAVTWSHIQYVAIHSKEKAIVLFVHWRGPCASRRLPLWVATCSHQYVTINGEENITVLFIQMLATWVEGLTSCWVAAMLSQCKNANPSGWRVPSSLWAEVYARHWGANKNNSGLTNERNSAHLVNSTFSLQMYRIRMWSISDV